MKETRREFLDQFFFRGPLVAAGIGLINGLSPKPPEREQEQWILHWDNTWKRVHPEGGIKFIIIPGLGSNSQDKESFKFVKEQSIYAAGFDEHDVLDMSYNVNTNNYLLGEQYDRKNSTQNPAISEGNMHMLMLWYKQHFPKDKFVMIGHSQGGYLAYELALRHSDRIAAVITLDGALKGADIIPGSLDRMLAYQIGGQAGDFFLNRCRTKEAYYEAFYEVENNVRDLVEQGMYFFPFSSADDLVVDPQHGFVDTASREIGGRKIKTMFRMGQWVDSPMSRYVNERLTEYQKNNGTLDSQTSDESAQLAIKQRLIGSWDGHSTVLFHPEVLEQMKYIINVIGSKNKYSTPQTTGYSTDQNRSYSFEDTNPLAELMSWLFGFGQQ